MSLVHPQRRPGWRLLPVVVIGSLLVVLVYVWTLPNASAGTCTSRVAIEVNASTEKAGPLGLLDRRLVPEQVERGDFRVLLCGSHNRVGPNVGMASLAGLVGVV